MDNRVKTFIWAFLGCAIFFVMGILGYATIGFFIVFVPTVIILTMRYGVNFLWIVLAGLGILFVSVMTEWGIAIFFIIVMTYLAKNNGHLKK